MFNEFLLIMMTGVAFLGGLCGYFVIHRMGTSGFHAYQGHFIARIGDDLKQNFRAESSERIFYGSLALAVILGVVGGIFLHLPGVVAGTTLGVLAPWLLLKWFQRQRIRQFVYQLPDALQTIASALRSGVNFTRAMEQVASRYSAPLSQEFSLVLAEYRVGRELGDALEDLRRRIPTQELALFCTAVNVSRSVGGNLADTLESLSKSLQEKAKIEQKIMALTAMGRAQGWVVGLLPVFIGFMLYLQQPDRMAKLFTTWYGWAVLIIIGAAMSIAVWLIWRIVDIDV